jgi:hypothetical protein
MKKCFFTLVVCVFLSATASASFIETVHLAFESGATLDGTINFNDDYLGIIDVDSYLNGGTYNYDNLHFTSSWWAEGMLLNPNVVNPYDSNDDGYYNDFLLLEGEVVGSHTTYVIGLSWDDLVSSENDHISFVLLADTKYSGVHLTDSDLWDPLIAPVPEPSTWLLLSSGLAGLAWYGRKRKKA